MIMRQNIDAPMTVILSQSTGVNDFLHRTADAGYLNQFIRDIRQFAWWIANHENVLSRYGDGIEWPEFRNTVRDMYDPSASVED